MDRLRGKKEMVMLFTDFFVGTSDAEAPDLPFNEPAAQEA
jgi:hypothetical protein